MGNRKKNIMILIGSLVLGGAERQAVQLAKHLPKDKYNVFIVLYRNFIDYKEIMSEPGVKVVVIPKKTKLSATFVYKLRKFIKSNKIDILHSYMMNTNFWARIMGLLTRVKVIVSVRNTNIGSGYCLMNSFLGNKHSYTVFNSQSAKKEYMRTVLIKNKKRLKVIHNGLDLSHFNKPLLRTRSSSLVVGMIAKVKKQKNHLCLFKAIRLMTEQERSQLKFLCVGRTIDRELAAKLQAYAGKYDMNVKFLPGREDILSVYQSLDLVILPSLYEGFPNVVMEAMAMGLPVIASDVSDNDLLVKEGVNGFLFKNDDPDDLKKKLITFIDMDKQKREQMGKEGKRIIEQFDIKKMVRSTEKLYLSLLSE
ncbi:glycosyltransferase [Thermoproteota archaeon]